MAKTPEGNGQRSVREGYCSAVGSGDGELEAWRADVQTGRSYLSSLRRVPSQHRGQEKVARILDAAQQLIVEIGYESTVSAPALLIERAKVSGGSFYTYFSSPDLVIEALALRFMEEARASAEKIAQEVHHDWVSAANRFFETFVGFYQQPAVYELWLGGRLSSAARQADADCNAFLAEQLSEMLHRSEIQPPSADPLRYRAAIEIYDYLMRLAFRSEGQDRADLLAEARHAFLTYLGSPDRAS